MADRWGTQLANDIASIIFQLLDVYSVGRCALVCKSWNEFAKSDALWEHLFRQVFSARVTAPLVKEIVEADGWRHACVSRMTARWRWQHGRDVQHRFVIGPSETFISCLDASEEHVAVVTEESGVVVYPLKSRLSDMHKNKIVLHGTDKSTDKITCVMLDGYSILLALRSGIVQKWSLEHNKKQAETLPLRQLVTRDLTIPSGKGVHFGRISGYYVYIEDCINVLHMTTLANRQVPAIYHRAVTALGTHSDARRIAYGDDDGYVRLVSLGDSIQSDSIRDRVVFGMSDEERTHLGSVSAVVFLSANTFITCSSDSFITIFKIQSDSTIDRTVRVPAGHVILNAALNGPFVTLFSHKFYRVIATDTLHAIATSNSEGELSDGELDREIEQQLLSASRLEYPNVFGKAMLQWGSPVDLRITETCLARSDYVGSVRLFLFADT